MERHGKQAAITHTVYRPTDKASLNSFPPVAVLRTSHDQIAGCGLHDSLALSGHSGAHHSGSLPVGVTVPPAPPRSKLPVSSGMSALMSSVDLLPATRDCDNQLMTSMDMDGEQIVQDGYHRFT